MPREHDLQVRHLRRWLGCLLAAPVLTLLACESPPTASQRLQPQVAEPATQGSHAAPRVAAARPVPNLVRDPGAIAALLDRERESEGGDLPRPRNPDARARERYRDRAGSDGVLSFDEVLRAKAQMDQMPVATVARGDRAWEWEWVGPGNIGGRIRSILIDPTDPDRMWVGAVGGGIWRTTNGGDSWEPLDDFLPTLGVSCMAMDPDDPDILYAGTGELHQNVSNIHGAGVFKSTNAGDTWNQLPGTTGFDSVNRLAINPLDPNEILAATNGGIWCNTHGGQGSWNLVWSGAVVMDIKFLHHVSDGEATAIAGTDDGRALWSDNWCSTPNHWNVAQSFGGERVELAGYDDIVYAAVDDNGGELWRSDDRGHNYQQVQITDAPDWFCHDPQSCQGYYDNAIWMSPVDPDFLVIGGIDLWRSTDGGQTLSKISEWWLYHVGVSAHADQHVIIHHPDYDGVTNRVVFVANDGGIQKAENIHGEFLSVGGWINLAHNLGVTQFYKGAAAPVANGDIIGGTQDNGVLKLGGGGDPGSWDQWYQCVDCTGDFGYCIISHAWPHHIFYAAAGHLHIWGSDNWGLAYVPCDINLEDSDNDSQARYIAPLRMHPNDQFQLVAGGRSIWKTTTGGWVGWTRIRDPLPANDLCSAIELARGYHDGDKDTPLWVGYENGRVSRRLSTGHSWVDVDDNGPNPLPNDVVLGIAINPNNHNEVYVAFGGNDEDRVWYTPDAGDTWESRSGEPNSLTGLPAIHVNAITLHPANPNRVYIGTDLGVFYSNDKGLNWHRPPHYRDGEFGGPLHTEVADVFWQVCDLIAATHGRGMFRTQPLDVDRIIYVDSDALPLGDGSWTFPFQHVLDGVNAATSGSTISIRAGRYEENDPNDPIRLTTRGTILARGGQVKIRNKPQ